MVRPIIVDPARFDGEPHIEGTAVTVEMVQALWKRPGVGAAETRAQFPELTEAELGAAVTYTPPWTPILNYCADWPGPPHRRFRLWEETVGWGFGIKEVDGRGAEQPLSDQWEEELSEILRYVERDAPRGLVWRNARTGAVVDIRDLRSRGQLPNETILP